MKTGALFRPVILRDRLKELNKKMSNMRPEEIVETVGPDFFNRVLNQYVHDEGVKLKTMKPVDGHYVIEEKKQESSVLLGVQDNIEDVSELGEERKSTNIRCKNDKSVNAIEDKNAMKELLERERRSPWIVRFFILMIILFLLGITVILVVRYFVYTETSNELRMAYTYAEISCRKTAELLYIKNYIRSLVFRNK